MKEMTRSFRTFSVPVSVFVLLAFFAGCQKSTNDPSPSEQMRSILLSGTWNLQSVTVDGADKTSIYSGLKLAFTAANFTAVDGRAIWPASGTWQFSDETGKNILRGDALPVTIGEATTSKLVLQLSWSKTTFGRTDSMKGAHVFTFGK